MIILIIFLLCKLFVILYCQLKINTMNKEFVLKSWELLKDATNPNNRFGINLATDDLFHRIEIDKMNSLEDYIDFKNKWYPQLKNQSF